MTIAWRAARIDIGPRALADEIIAQPGNVDVGDHAAALDFRIDDAHAPCAHRSSPPIRKPACADANYRPRRA